MSEITKRALSSAGSAVRRLNPDVFNDVRPLPGAVRQPDQRPPLGGEKTGAGRRANGLSYRVAIIGLRRRILDADNFVAGCKGLRDAIARRLGVDDAEKYVEWRYEQVQWNGEEGEVLRIEDVK